MTSTQTSSGTKDPFFRPAFYVYAALVVIITGLVFSIYFSPALYYDDWGQFVLNYFKGTLPWIIPDFIRPLSNTPLRLETALFGLNLKSLVTVQICLLSLEALLFFILFEKLKLFPTILNFAAALLILFSPMDMTRMWLLLSPFMMIFVLIYMICLVLYTENKNPVVLMTGMIFGFITLLYYEIQLGLIIIFPLVLFLMIRIRDKKNFWWLMLPVFLGVDYLIFRALGIAYKTAEFHDSQSITLIYLLRQLRNAIVCLFNGWLIPIKMDLAIGMAALWSSIFSIIFIGYHYVRYGFEKDVINILKTMAALLGAGVLVWLAGYIPWVVYGIPSIIDWFSSRAHNTAIPGAIFALITIIYFLASLVQANSQRKQIVMAVLVMPFLIVGVMSQIAIQRENKILWNDYRMMWNGIFKEVPGITDQTHVVLVISPNPEIPRYGEREFFTSASFNGEITIALRVFYANDTLEGEFMYKNMELPDTPMLVERGIRNPPTYSGTIPYSDILFIEFNRDNKTVSVIQDLKRDFGIFDPFYMPEKHIERRPLSKPTLRYILD